MDDGSDAARADLSNIAFELSIPVAAGEHTIKIRTVDTRTGAMSPEFVGTTDGVTESPTPGGISGFVWEDSDGDGTLGS